jgi:hypothetical protein
MKNPNIKTKVIHSKSSPAWNVVGTKLGGKYKIAKVPYLPSESMEVLDKERDEALEHATFISYCFNNSHIICLDDDEVVVDICEERLRLAEGWD